MASDDIVTINQGYEVRTSGSGRQRTTVTVKSEPLVHNFNAAELGRGPALALVQYIKNSILSINEVAKPATLRARKAALDAFNHVQKQREQKATARKAKAAQKSKEPSKPRVSHPKQEVFSVKKPARASTGSGDADRRYAGGKLGPMAPNRSDKLFNDSGRLAYGVAAAPVGDEWIVNVPANRFSAETLDNGGAAALPGIMALFQRLVPMAGLSADIGFRNALKAASPIAKATARTRELNVQAAQALWGIARQVLSLVA